jgi:hypothetical protein
MKTLLGGFIAKLGREIILKATIENDSLHQGSNDYGVRIVNFATSTNLFVKSIMFTRRNIHKYTWVFPNGKTHNQVNYILIDRKWHSSILDFRGAGCDIHHYLLVAEVRESLVVSKNNSTKVSCGEI